MRVPLICLALCACAEESSQEKVRPGAAMDAESGTALASQGRHTEAIDAYQQAAALAPRSVKVHYNLGNAYVRQLLAYYDTLHVRWRATIRSAAPCALTKGLSTAPLPRIMVILSCRYCAAARTGCHRWTKSASRWRRIGQRPSSKLRSRSWPRLCASAAPTKSASALTLWR